MPFITLVARTSAPADQAVPLVRSAIRGISSDLALHNLMPLEALVEETVSSRHLALILLLVFAGVSLGLAAIGIYSVVSYAVGQRAQEIGVRMALGATRTDILKLIVGSNLRIIGFAVAVGLCAAAAASSALQSVLYGVASADLSIYLMVSAVTLGLAIAASLLPAFKATSIDPASALRLE